MPTYDYKCDNCEYIYEVRQSFSEKPLVECPKCSQQTLERVITGGITPIIQSEPKTLGQLAERNTKKMGQYELQEKRIHHKKSEKNARIRAIEESGGTHIDKNVEHKPFYGKPDYNKLNKMTNKQKEKFILKGN